jgi:hypothetical protein
MQIQPGPNRQVQTILEIDTTARLRANPDASENVLCRPRGMCPQLHGVAALEHPRIRGIRSLLSNRLAAGGGLHIREERPRAGLLPCLVLKRDGGIGSATRSSVQGRHRP